MTGDIEEKESEKIHLTLKPKEETGRSSMREVESYKVHPNVLKGLFQGKGVIHLPTKQGVVTEKIMFKAFNQLEVI